MRYRNVSLKHNCCFVVLDFKHEIRAITLQFILSITQYFQRQKSVIKVTESTHIKHAKFEQLSFDPRITIDATKPQTSKIYTR